MAELRQTPAVRAPFRATVLRERVWLMSMGILALLAVVDPDQALDSAVFTVEAFLGTAPWLILSVGMAAWAGATGADNLIARAFTGRALVMIALAAMAGGLSPFCSCGVIPLIAALLAMGVPLSAVMAFWLSSPLMDPSMFTMTLGVLGPEFAVAKTLAAIGLGLVGGLVTHSLMRAGTLTEPLREGVGDGGCGGAKIRAPKPVVWRFWADSDRRAKFLREAVSTLSFLARWLVLAFVLESLMLAFVPPEAIATTLGAEGPAGYLWATLVGVPAYLNGYAALPLVSGLIEQGMAPGAGMAFLIAGGVTSIPAAIAVWALARPPVFALYIVLSLLGALASGAFFALWLAH